MMFVLDCTGLLLVAVFATYSVCTLGTRRLPFWRSCYVHICVTHFPSFVNEIMVEVRPCPCIRPFLCCTVY